MMPTKRAGNPVAKHCRKKNAQSGGVKQAADITTRTVKNSVPNSGRGIAHGQNAGKGQRMSNEEANDIIDERDCNKCVWRSEAGCTVWSCDYLSRHELHQILDAHPGLRMDKTNAREYTDTHDCISRQALCEYALNQKDKSVTPNDIMRFPSAQPDKDMIHLQKEQAYMQGWEDGRNALREEIWEDERDRLD